MHSRRHSSPWPGGLGRSPPGPPPGGCTPSPATPRRRPVRGAACPRVVSLPRGLGLGAATPSAAVAPLAAGVLPTMNGPRITVLARVAPAAGAGGMTRAFGLPPAARPAVPEPSPPADPPAVA